MPTPGPCSTLTDPGCVQPVNDPWGPPMPEIGASALDGLADATREALRWFLENTMTWWVKLDSPDLEQEAAVGFLQQLMLPITSAVAVLAALTVAGKMALTHKANPLIDLGSGLALIAVTGALGVILPNQLLKFGDAWADWAISSAAGGDFEKSLPSLLSFEGVPAALAVVLGIIALIVGAIQAVLLMFRQGALVILAGLLPLAAAGTLTGATRPWLKKVAGWMLALIFYKPAAAAVYAVAFTLVGSGKNLQAALMGFAMMVISLVAFPVLLKFFTWTTGAADSSGGGTFLNAFVGGATAIGALRGSFGSSAGEHAGFMSEQLDSRSDQSTQTPPPQDGPGASEPGQPDDGQPPGQSHPTDAQEPSPESTHSPAGGAEEPVGPTAWQTAQNEQRRGRDTLRWLNHPTGAGDAGGDGDTGQGGGTSG